MPPVQRLLLSNTDQSPVHVLAGIKLADHMCEKSGTLEVIFLVSAKASLDSGPLHDALGASVHKALAEGKPVKLPSGALMHCETMDSLRWVSKPSVLIAVFAGQAMMDKIDSLQNLVGVVAVPWTPEAIEDWTRAWSPKVLGKPITSDTLD